MSGGYFQQGYHQPQPPIWVLPQTQLPGYGYMQLPQYISQPLYGAYQSSYPDQSSTQQAGTGYDYYNQQQPSQQQPAGGSAPPADSSSYNYGLQGSYGDPSCPQQQGYGPDGYSGGYAQPGYAQPASTPQVGHDQQQGQDGSALNYSTQGPPTQVPPQQAPTSVTSATQQGYNGQLPSAAAANYPSPPPPYCQKPPTQLPPTPQAGYVQQGYMQTPPIQYGYAQALTPSASGLGGPQPSSYSQPSTHSGDNAASVVPPGVTKASPQN